MSAAAKPPATRRLTGGETLAFANLDRAVDEAVLCFVDDHRIALGDIFRGLDIPAEDLRASIQRLTQARKIEFHLDGTGTIEAALTILGSRETLAPAYQPPDPEMKRLASACDGQKSTLREAAADIVLSFLAVCARDRYIDDAMYRTIYRRTGLRREQVDQAFDDLAAGGRVAIMVEGGALVVEPLSDVEAPGAPPAANNSDQPSAAAVCEGSR